MPRVRVNRTAGARREVTYLGVSQQGALEGNERAAKRARREKRALIREAQRISQPAGDTDWKVASERIRRLQARWKVIPSAGREHDERLYKRFKKVCEHFRRQRREHLAALTQSHRASAAVKEQLIAEVQSLSTITDEQSAKHQFSELMARWRAAGSAGGREAGLTDRLRWARQAIGEEDQSSHARRAEERIAPQRQAVERLRALRRELHLRRQQVKPGWLGGQTIEELDRRMGEIDEDIAAREVWLAEDERLRTSE
ncbi:MAG: DUF349 domain-containing protein [Solirubrobacteraceae bacterium]